MELIDGPWNRIESCMEACSGRGQSGVEAVGDRSISPPGVTLSISHMLLFHFPSGSFPFLSSHTLIYKAIIIHSHHTS